ncbi:MAG: DUF350 domain-containing protein [Candidatus Poribacteria bacterium]|nr:DUF350 domain-containing protein [Candidatus Poribacteria bacterium]
MAKRIVSLSFCIALGCIVAASMWSTRVSAQETGGEVATGTSFIDLKHLALSIIESIVYSILGMVVLVVGYKIFDLVTPYHLDHQIAEENNAAAGIAVAGMLIALGLIVASAISG